MGRILFIGFCVWTDFCDQFHDPLVAAQVVGNVVRLEERRVQRGVGPGS